MILGVGIDTVDVARIRRALQRFGDHFIQRLYTSSEQVEAGRLIRPERYLASRFAAKEALSKALGTGMAQGVTWQDICVKKHVTGQPFIDLRGRSQEVLASLVPLGFQPQIHLSLTDTNDSAQALVLISALTRS